MSIYPAEHFASRGLTLMITGMITGALLMISLLTGCGCRETAARLEEERERVIRAQEELAQTKIKNANIRAEAQASRASLKEAQSQIEQLSVTRESTVRDALISTLTQEEIQGFIEDCGGEVERVSSDRVHMFVSFNGRYIAQVGFQASGGELYGLSTIERRADLELVNLWNRESSFSRAYVDARGGLVLGADLSLRGGVSREAVEGWFKRWRDSVVSFHRKIKGGS